MTINVSPDMLRKQLTIIGSWTFSAMGQAECARFVVDNGDVYLYDGFGRIYHFDRSLNLLGRALPAAEQNGRPTYGLYAP